jgi:hypothetical protein
MTEFEQFTAYAAKVAYFIKSGQLDDNDTMIISAERKTIVDLCDLALGVAEPAKEFVDDLVEKDGMTVYNICALLLAINSAMIRRAIDEGCSAADLAAVLGGVTVNFARSACTVSKMIDGPEREQFIVD